MREATRSLGRSGNWIGRTGRSSVGRLQYEATTSSCAPQSSSYKRRVARLCYGSLGRSVARTFGSVGWVCRVGLVGLVGLVGRVGWMARSSVGRRQYETNDTSNATSSISIASNKSTTSNGTTTSNISTTSNNNTTRVGPLGRSVGSVWSAWSVWSVGSVGWMERSSVGRQQYETNGIIVHAAI